MSNNEVKMVKCPLCGTHKPMERTGVMRLQKGKGFDRPYTFRFDHVDLASSAFISIRKPGGRGKGLPEIGRVSLAEAKSDPRYKVLLTSLINQSYRILKILTD